jgi:Scaffold protein Nfu/NifU N terminal
LIVGVVRLVLGLGVVAAMTRVGGRGRSDQSAPAGRRSYDRGVAHASPSPTPNPNAMKFMLDTTLPATLNITSAEAAAGHRFAEAVFAAGGVAAIYGVNDFITVTREPGFEWDRIVAAVVAAAASDL